MNILQDMHAFTYYSTQRSLRTNPLYVHRTLTGRKTMMHLAEQQQYYSMLPPCDQSLPSHVRLWKSTYNLLHTYFTLNNVTLKQNNKEHMYSHLHNF